MFRLIATLSVTVIVTLVEPVSLIDAESLPQKVANTNTKLQGAKAAREVIETREKEVAQSIDELLRELEATINKIPSDALQEEQLALDHLKEIAAVLREQSENILKKRDAYAKDFRSLQEALQAAPEEFRKAAEAFREYAQNEPFEDIQAAYLRLSESWDNLAKQTEQRAKEASGPDVDEWEAGCRYIASIAKFASRLEQHLDAFPGTDQLGRQRKYSEELQSLIKHFETLKELLQDFNSRLAKEALASNLNAEPSVPASAPITHLASHTKGIPDAPRHATPSTWVPTPTTTVIPSSRVSDSGSRSSHAPHQAPAKEPFNLDDFIPDDPLAANVKQHSHTATSGKQSQPSATRRVYSRIPAHHRGYYR